MIIAVVLGAAVGLIWPEVGKSLEPIGTGFVALIKMMIAPIIFCTIVVGVGSIAKAATVGKIGGLALLYFMVMSTFALAIGLVVGNIIHPGAGLDMANSTYDATKTEAKTTTEFILGIIPTTFFSPSRVRACFRCSSSPFSSASHSRGSARRGLRSWMRSRTCRSWCSASSA